MQPPTDVIIQSPWPGTINISAQLQLVYAMCDYLVSGPGKLKSANEVCSRQQYADVM